MNNPRGWKLRIRRGDTDTEIALAFTRACLPGTEHIETVDGLSVPELYDPDQNLVVQGEKEISEYLRLAQEFQSC